MSLPVPSTHWVYRAAAFLIDWTPFMYWVYCNCFEGFVEALTTNLAQKNGILAGVYILWLHINTDQGSHVAYPFYSIVSIGMQLTVYCRDSAKLIWMEVPVWDRCPCFLLSHLFRGSKWVSDSNHCHLCCCHCLIHLLGLFAMASLVIFVAVMVALISVVVSRTCHMSSL